MESEKVGKKVRIVMIGNFYYSGVILEEDESFVTIKDKFGKKVSLHKDRIESLEVSEDE